MNLTRREAIEIGAAAGASLLLGWQPAFAQVSLVEKAIPGSGERVPVVGLGGRDYRAGPGEDLSRFRDTIATFARFGGKVVDTAPSYGNSESIIGASARDLGIRDRLFLASKVDQAGRELGRARIEASFTALGTTKVDLMQVHNLRDATTQLATLRELKAQGRVRYVGITSSSDDQYAEMERLMEREALDFIQVDYSLRDRNAAERILPLAADRGLGVLTNLPFGRASLFRAVGDRPLAPWAAETDCASWAQVFLKYVVSHPAVTCAIPGMTQARHAEDNMGAARGRMPDAAMRTTMERFFDQLPRG